MEKEQKLIKNILMYMIANLGAKLLLLIIYPIYTYYVIPYELGVYDLIISTLTLLYPIIVFSINDAVLLFVISLFLILYILFITYTLILSMDGLF